MTESTHPEKGDLESGSVFAERFRIASVVGRGGMSVVYEARDLETDQRIALKVLRVDRNANDEARARFSQEATILAQISVPSIVQIYAHADESDDALWIAMEYLEGQTLAERIRNDGPLSPEELVPVLSTISEALDAAHAQGVIHRDLKPENVFVTTQEDGSSQVKLLDFGLSRSELGSRLTKTGTTIGTPRYMAPEQIDDPTHVDESVDVYGMGIVAYEALTGESPFSASDQGQLLGAIMQGERVALSERMPELRKEISGVLDRAMAKKDERFKTPEEFAEALAAAVGVPSGRRQRRISTRVVFGELEEIPRETLPGDEPLDPGIFGQIGGATSFQPPRPTEWPQTAPPPSKTPIIKTPEQKPSQAPKLILALLLLAAGVAAVYWKYMQ